MCETKNFSLKEKITNREKRAIETLISNYMPKERLFFRQGLPNALEINISQMTSRINC